MLLIEGNFQFLPNNIDVCYIVYIQKGRVDVSLERNGKRIAIEIKDTTKDDWELQNIEKCLKAGYEVVIECAT